MKEVGGKVFINKLIKGRSSQHYKDQNDSQDQRDKRKEDRFTKKRYHQAALTGAQRFFHGDFRSPGHGLCCRQVHVVDTGQQDNEYAYSSEGVQIGHVALGFIGIQVRMEMNVGQWLEY